MPVVAVSGPDPVSLARLVRGLSSLRETVPGVVPRVVVNRLRPGVMAREPATEIRAALDRYAGVSAVHFLPYERTGLDAALAGGRLLAEVTPRSPLRLALAELAAGLVGAPVAPVRRGWRRRGT